MLKRWQVAPLLLLLTASAAFPSTALGTSAQVPDPRDSIILESKTVAPGLAGNPAFTMKVYITNKDTIVYLCLALEERTIIDKAYVVLDDNGEGGRDFTEVVTPLKNSLDNYTFEYFGGYDEISPDSFFVAGAAGHIDPFGWPVGFEPPNPTRSAVWELRFKSISESPGEIQFDSITIRYVNSYGTYILSTGYTVSKYRGQVQYDIPSNFAKSVITIQPLKGDMNLDSKLRPSDVVLLLNFVYLGVLPPVGLSYCDLNCDGEATAVDVAFLLNAVFREEEFPC